MPGAARVQTVQVVQDVAVALRRFAEDAGAALDELQLEVHRALEWIGGEVPHYWKAAERRAWDGLSAARVQLEQARTTKRIAEHDPACREEKKAMQKAQQRLDMIHEKQAALRHWHSTIEKAVNEYRARSRQLSGWLEGDLPRALAALNHMTNALESYLAVQAVDEVGPPLPSLTAAVDEQPVQAEIMPPAESNAPPPPEK